MFLVSLICLFLARQGQAGGPIIFTCSSGQEFEYTVDAQECNIADEGIDCTFDVTMVSGTCERVDPDFVICCPDTLMETTPEPDVCQDAYDTCLDACPSTSLAPDSSTGTSSGTSTGTSAESSTGSSTGGSTGSGSGSGTASGSGSGSKSGRAASNSVSGTASGSGSESGSGSGSGSESGSGSGSGSGSESGSSSSSSSTNTCQELCYDDYDDCLNGDSESTTGTGTTTGQSSGTSSDSDEVSDDANNSNGAARNEAASGVYAGDSKILSWFVIPLVILIGVVAIIGGGYYLYKRNKKTISPSPQETQDTLGELVSAGNTLNAPKHNRVPSTSVNGEITV